MIRTPTKQTYGHQRKSQTSMCAVALSLVVSGSLVSCTNEPSEDVKIGKACFDALAEKGEDGFARVKDYCLNEQDMKALMLDPAVDRRWARYVDSDGLMNVAAETLRVDLKMLKEYYHGKIDIDISKARVRSVLLRREEEVGGDPIGRMCVSIPVRSLPKEYYDMKTPFKRCDGVIVEYNGGTYRLELAVTMVKISNKWRLLRLTEHHVGLRFRKSESP